MSFRPRAPRRRAALAPLLVPLALVAAAEARATEGPPDAKVAALEAELGRTRAELDGTKQALAATQDALALLAKRVDAMQGGAAAPGTAPPPAPGGATARLAPVNVDNPAVSFVVDVQGRSNTKGGEGAGFALGSGELFLSAPIDPFLRGYAALNGSSEEGFDIEEAALVTTALPWNFTVKGGRFFADVGRLSHWHDEALPFVDRPPSLERLVGGESGAEGLEVSWLAPFEPYLHVTAGLYNAIGSERREDIAAFFRGKRSFSELTYLVRPSTYLDLTDALNVEVGGSLALVPQDSRRQLYGVDVTLRHQPGSGGFYQGAVLGAEWLWNHERFDDERPVVDDAGALVFEDPDDPASLNAFEPAIRRFRRTGGYAYAEAFFGRRFSAGVRFDLSQALRSDPIDTSVRYDGFAALPGSARDEETMYSAFLTWMPSEFHRLRLQGDQIVRRGDDDQRVTLQWTAFLGSHSHGFNVR
jgi:hypothetical protein